MQVHAYGPEVRTAASARRLVRSALGHLPHPVVEDVVLVVSELVTNGLRHAHSEVELHVRTHSRTVFVAVRDACSRPPLPTRPGPFDAGGRGLQIVQAVATRWGVQAEPGGKIVWCEIPTDAPAALAALAAAGSEGAPHQAHQGALRSEPAGARGRERRSQRTGPSHLGRGTSVHRRQPTGRQSTTAAPQTVSMISRETT